MKKLSLGQKIAYSMGGMAMNLTNLVIAQWIFKRYTDPPNVMLVGALAMSIIVFSGRASDAITDPIIGNWSDNFRSRWGRRIPFIAWGTIPFAIVFFLLWTPPSETMGWINVVYIFVMVQLSFIFYTIVVTPYLGLLPEITSDLDERVNITTMQAVFVMLGTIAFVAMGVIKEKGGWMALGGVVGVITLISFFPTVFFVKEKKDAIDYNQEKTPLWESIRMTMSNRPFMYLVISTSFYWFALNIMLMLIPYWVQNYLGLKESAVSVIMGPFLAANLVFFFVFNWVSHEKGKFLAYQIMALGSALLVPLLSLSWFIPKIIPGMDLLLYSSIVMGLLGIPVAGFSMLPFAVLSDVVDYDETISGKRREAIYFGVQAIFQKTIIGLSIFAFGLVAIVGDKISIHGLMVVPLIAAVAFFIAFLAFTRYPIRERGGELYLGDKLINRKK